MKVLATQSCPTLCGPMNCSPLGSSVHGILQVRILEWVAIPFSRGSSQPRGPCAVQTHVIQGSAALSSHSGQALGWLLRREIVKRRMLLLKTPIELVWVRSFPLFWDSGTMCHSGRDQWHLLCPVLGGLHEGVCESHLQ